MRTPGGVRMSVNSTNGGSDGPDASRTNPADTGNKGDRSMPAGGTRRARRRNRAAGNTLPDKPGELVVQI